MTWQKWASTPGRSSCRRDTDTPEIHRELPPGQGQPQGCKSGEWGASSPMQLVEYVCMREGLSMVSGLFKRRSQIAGMALSPASQNTVGAVGSNTRILHSHQKAQLSSHHVSWYQCGEKLVCVLRQEHRFCRDPCVCFYVCEKGLEAWLQSCKPRR